MGRGLETVLAVLNGLVGDHLARSGNGLETPMTFAKDGEPFSLDRLALARLYPAATPRIVVLVHGLMNTEAIWAFPGAPEPEPREDYGSFLARDSRFTPFYLRYNTGLPIVDNGASLARLLDDLVRSYPMAVEEILLIGYSMGGLVVRSACHEAMAHDLAFLPLVRRAIYVGTPHHGAPTERLGRIVSSVLHAINDPYTRLVGDIANLRSAGLQDLGDADLRHEDRERRALGAPGLRLSDWRHPVPLLPQVKHHLIAGALSEAPWLHAFFGDSVVPVPSALAGGRTGDPSGTHVTRLLPGLSHIALAHDPEVYDQILAWAAVPP